MSAASYRKKTLESLMEEQDELDQAVAAAGSARGPVGDERKYPGRVYTPFSLYAGQGRGEGGY